MNHFFLKKFFFFYSSIQTRNRTCKDLLLANLRRTQRMVEQVCKLWKYDKEFECDNKRI